LKLLISIKRETAMAVIKMIAKIKKTSPPSMAIVLQLKSLELNPRGPESKNHRRSNRNSLSPKKVLLPRRDVSR